MENTLRDKEEEFAQLQLQLAETEVALDEARLEKSQQQPETEVNGVAVEELKARVEELSKEIEVR